MSAFDRIEHQMPELMTELASPTVPDYLDDLLGQTRRARQRPAWASLERWLPMDVVARPTAFRAPALRPLLVLVLIGLLVAASVGLIAGTQRPRVPPPFGVAQNGIIVVSDPEGDIASFDPVTGTTTPLITGPTKDLAPWFSRDGRQFMFVRETSPETGSYWVANADGSNLREVIPAPVEWFEWSDDGGRVVVNRRINARSETSIVDVSTGTTIALDLDVQIEHPYWRPGHDQVVFRRAPDGASDAYWIVDADGSNAHAIAGVAPGAVNDPQLSPDGALLAYSTWSGSTAATQGRIHVLDIDSGTDREIMFDGSAGTTELDPQFSPDGSRIVFERYGGDASYRLPDGEFGYRLVIAAADGSGPATALGPVYPGLTGGAAVEFSPDGTQLLVTYNQDGATWLLDVDGSGQQQLPWNGSSGASWQRLAP